MSQPATVATADFDAFLEAQANKGLLRFITCGSVDDGKSTLIGRMLYESHLVFDDHLSALAKDSKTSGTQGDDLDLALLVDGLQAEREQGITIDVAYRYFSTERRTFIVADTPGHEQYTRNMITGASNVDLAVILVDARKGLLTQTRRHSFLVSLLGIRHVVLAVNKMDLVGYDEQIFTTITRDYAAFAAQLGLHDVVSVPLSALTGDNVVRRSGLMPWYSGPMLFDHLESVPFEQDRDGEPFRLAVQLVLRPDHEFRGFSGMVLGGEIRPGMAVQVGPGGASSSVDRIVTMDGDLDLAVTGQSVTITLADEIDLSRGDMLFLPDNPPQVSASLDANLVWMAEEPMHLGARYLVKIGTRTVGATVEKPKYRVDVNTLEREATDTLRLNEIGRCVLRLDRAVAFDRYEENRNTGGFIVIDRLTESTVAAGMILDAAASSDIRWQQVAVDRQSRAMLNGHQPAVVWLTGISGAGKSTIANLVEQQLHARGVRTYLLDGDNLRHGLNKDLGFSPEDRTENIRRSAEVAALMADAGIVVVCAFVSPFAADRDAARQTVGAGFFEVHVHTESADAEARDPKGLYRRARAGEIKGLTGFDGVYEQPIAPQLKVDTSQISAADAAMAVVNGLVDAGVLSHR